MGNAGNTDEGYAAWLGELSRLRQEGRARDGLYAGKPLNGYLRAAGREAHVVDERKRRAIRRLFLDAPRKSYRELLRITGEEGLAAAGGGRMGLSSLHNMLTNPFYAGLVSMSTGLVQGKHEAIVSTKEFEVAQRSFKGRVILKGRQ